MGQCLLVKANCNPETNSNEERHVDEKLVPNEEIKAMKVVIDSEEAGSTHCEYGEVKAMKVIVETASTPKRRRQDSTCEFGKFQSPINIVTADQDPLSAQNMAPSDQNSDPLRFNYPESIAGCTILNNGHTVQINLPSDSACSLHKGDQEYHLKQFHFHVPSEHTIDDKQYEMEMHLVHMNAKNEIAVLGFIFTTQQQHETLRLVKTKSKRHWEKQSKSTEMKEVQQEEEDELSTDDDLYENEKPINHVATSKYITLSVPGQQPAETVQPDVDAPNDFLAQFWDELPTEKTEEEIALSTPISFNYLFRTSAKHFKQSVDSNEIEIEMEIFEYQGSLTTPPYTEGVQWMVSKSTHFINAQQLHELSACWGHHNNAREVQELHGRTVSIRSQSSVRGIDFK